MNIYIILTCFFATFFHETACDGASGEMLLPNDLLERFIGNFIQYQNYKHISFLRKYYDDSSWERWILKSLHRLMSNTGSYISVLHTSNFTLEDENLKEMGSLTQGIPQKPRILYIAPLMSDVHHRAFKEVMAGGTMAKQHWLLICFKSIPVALRDIYFPLDNRIFFAVLNKTSLSDISLWEIYQASPQFPQRYQLLQRWGSTRKASDNATEKEEEQDGRKKEEEIFLFSKEPWSRRSNLDGLHIRCTTIMETSYISGAERRNGSIYLTGIYGDLWRLFQEMLNFTSTCVVPPDSRWGSYHEGNWTGAIGQVVRGEADIAIASFSFTYERAQVVTFLHSVTIFWYAMAMKRESSSDQMWTSYTRVFTLGSWAGVFIWVMAVALVLYYVVLLSPSQPKVSLSDAMFVSVSALCNQGSDKFDFRSTSSRIVFITIYGTMILTSTYYTCSLISSLTVEVPNVPFRSFEGLYNARNRYTFGFPGGTAAEEYFENSQIPLYRAIWKDMILKDPLNLANDEVQFRRVLEGRHISLSVSYRKQEEECLGMTHLPGSYFISRAAWTVAKNSPLAPLFNYHLLRSMESGINDKFSRQWKSQQPRCDLDSNVDPIYFHQVLSAHALLALGAVLALLIVGLENVKAKKVKTIDKKIGRMGKQDPPMTQKHD